MIQYHDHSWADWQLRQPPQSLLKSCATDSDVEEYLLDYCPLSANRENLTNSSLFVLLRKSQRGEERQRDTDGIMGYEVVWGENQQH